MERFFRHSEYVDAKDGRARPGALYRVEDVMVRNGILTTRAGAKLSPVPQPGPASSPMRPDNEPEVEPTPIQAPLPSP
jgi:hypothetical protein